MNKRIIRRIDTIGTKRACEDACIPYPGDPHESHEMVSVSGFRTMMRCKVCLLDSVRNMTTIVKPCEGEPSFNANENVIKRHAPDYWKENF